MGRGSKSSQQPTMMEVIVGFFQTHIKVVSSVAVLFFGILWLYPEYPITGMLNGLNNVSNDITKVTKPKYMEEQEQVIAVGWNTNLDLIVPAIPLFEALNHNQPLTPQDHDKIQTLEQLHQVFAFYFKKSSAAERHITSDSLFASILNQIQQFPPEQQQYLVGGNAGIMANVLAKNGYSVILGGPIGSQLKELLHPNISTVSSKADNAQDQIHLILEYPAQATWNGITSTRANRFILTHDTENSRLTGMENLHERIVQDDSVQALVVSGYHLLQEEDAEFRNERIKESTTQFQALNTSMKIHLELASMSDRQYIQQLAMTTFPFVDSLGFNEQELALMYEAIDGSNETIKKKQSLSQKVPPVRVVADALEILLHKYSPRSAATAAALGNRGIQRLHFHSYAYHMIAQIATKKTARAEAKSDHVFKNPRAAVAKGSLAGTLTACDTTLANMQESDGYLPAPLNFAVNSIGRVRKIEVDDIHPVATWQRQVEVEQADEFGDKSLVIDFYYAPVVACKAPKRTVGLGDSISSAALTTSVINQE